MIRTLLLAAVCAVSLTACQGTVVETLPEGVTSDCPAALRGAWIGLDDDDRAHADAGMHVADDCTTTVVETHAGKTRESTLVPRFLTVGEAGIVLYPHADVARVLDWKADTAQPAGGWWPLEWRRSGKRLVLHLPDHRRIATLIVNGALDGEAHWTSGDSGYNVLRGDAGAIRERLVEDALFDRDREIELERVGDGRRDLDRAIERARRDARSRDGKR
ncbi:MAG TPA: hypothetical protein VND91_06430 [Candidatus Saccharimonadia bacterium]|nr:hypothetical protein [Candidatus Saccharimonadia bacterium]